MPERDAKRLLVGRIELGDAYLGGELIDGKRGRGADSKTPFVVAVGTTPVGKPVRLKLRQVTGFCLGIRVAPRSKTRIGDQRRSVPHLAAMAAVRRTTAVPPASS